MADDEIRKFVSDDMKFLGNIEVTDEMIRRFKEKRKLAEKRRQQIMRGD